MVEQIDALGRIASLVRLNEISSWRSFGFHLPIGRGRRLNGAVVASEPAPMADYETDSETASNWSLRAILLREWPYFAMLILTLFGVAYTSIARQSMTTYWVILVPCFGAICVASHWTEVEGRDEHWRLIRTQVLHWAAVLLAMELVFIADVRQIMNSDASALMALTVLALGTFTAGVHVASWRICLVGTILGLGVPAIAWLEEATLLLLLGAVVLVAIGALFLLRGPSGADKDATPA
jgi:hypothetical protein